MGSTNKTTNLELSQFLGTDKPSWLNDYNADMLAIDSAVGTNVTDISTAQSRADSAYTLADNTASSVSTLSTQVSANTTDIATAQGNITTINSLIGNGTPTTTDQTIIGAINEINADMKTLNSNQSNVGIYFKSATVTFSASDSGRLTISTLTDGVVTKDNILGFTALISGACAQYGLSSDATQIAIKLEASVSDTLPIKMMFIYSKEL